MSIKETGIGADVAAQLAKLSLADIKLAPEADAPAPQSAQEPAALAYAPGQMPSGAVLDAVTQWLKDTHDHTHTHADDPELAQAHRAKADAIDDLQNALATASSEEKGNLQAALDRVRGAKSPEAIRAAIADAHKAVAAATANDKVETPEKKADRLWGEMKELNEKASKEFDKLPTTEEEKDEKAKLVEAIKKAEETGNKEEIIKAQSELIKFYKRMGIKYDSDPLVKFALEMEQKNDQIKNEVSKLSDQPPGAKVDSDHKIDPEAEALIKAYRSNNTPVNTANSPSRAEELILSDSTDGQEKITLAAAEVSSTPESQNVPKVTTSTHNRRV